MGAKPITSSGSGSSALSWPRSASPSSDIVSNVVRVSGGKARDLSHIRPSRSGQSGAWAAGWRSVQVVLVAGHRGQGATSDGRVLRAVWHSPGQPHVIRHYRTFGQPTIRT